MGTIELATGIDHPTQTRSTTSPSSPALGCADPGTPHPLWTAFLNRVTGNNDALIGFLQRFLGYCMTGHVHEHVLVFLYGTGANGKTRVRQHGRWHLRRLLRQRADRDVPDQQIRPPSDRDRAAQGRAPGRRARDARRAALGTKPRSRT